jgi:hypothetical protein
MSLPVIGFSCGIAAREGARLSQLCNPKKLESQLNSNLAGV